MSALEIIEQIKALPPEQKAVVAEFVRGLDVSAAHKSDQSSQPEVKEAAETIFNRYDELFRKLAE